MPTKYVHPKSTKELANTIDSLDNVTSISMTLNKLIVFAKAFDLGFNGKHRTYKGIPITICVGDKDRAVSIHYDLL